MVKDSNAQPLQNICPNKTTIYAVIGDSFAEGMGYKKVRESLPVGMKHYKVHSIVGEMSSVTMKRITATNIPKGSTIMVFTGINDLIRIGSGFISRPTKIQMRLIQNVDNLIKWAEKKEIKIVLATIPPCGGYRSPHNFYRNVPAATLHGINNYNKWLLAQRSKNVIVLDLDSLKERPGSKNMASNLTTDGLHPNTNGFVIIARMLRKELTNKTYPIEQHASMTRNLHSQAK
jgi:hypothetical protein